MVEPKVPRVNNVTNAVSRHGNEQRMPQPPKEIEILWINGGLLAMANQSP